MQSINKNGDGQAESPTAATAAARLQENVAAGVRTLFNRILKEEATVPLFIAQSMAESMRDLGYPDTTAAVCEMVDNAIQADATEIRVYFHEKGRGGSRTIDILVYDNGKGMTPVVLRAVTAFGGSTCFNSRHGIGRFGVGMKASALSQGPSMDLYSWQEPNAIYNMCLDLKAIGNDRKTVVELPEASFVGVPEKLPAEIKRILSSPMVYPKTENHQTPFAVDPELLSHSLERSGTILYIPDCDRLSYSKSKTLVDHATQDMARIYRYFLARGLKLFINNRRVVPVDPLYTEESAWHVQALTQYELESGKAIKEKFSRKLFEETVDVAVAEGASEAFPVRVRIMMLPEEWHELPRKVLKNDLRVFDEGISFLRGEREVFLGPNSKLVGKLQVRDLWWRMEVAFPAALDEAFGISVNKQGIRPQGYVLDAIRQRTREVISQARSKIRESEARRSAKKEPGKISEAERRASAAEVLQSTILPKPKISSEAERERYEEHLRTLGQGLRQEDESLEQAMDRIRGATYLTQFKHDDDAPFYRVDYDFELGKVLLTINSAHPFYAQVYHPLAELVHRAGAQQVDGEDADERDLALSAKRVIEGIQLMLFSLGRTQVEMSSNDPEEHTERLFKNLRKQWSLNLDTILSQA